MTSWEPLHAGNGKMVYVEVDVQQSGGREEVGFSGPLSVDNLTEAVRAVADSLQTGLSNIRADKVSIEVGVEFGIQAGHLVALIAKGTGKANLKLTVEWSSIPPHAKGMTVAISND